MFSSLRSRLWLSYALFIFAALFITAVILIFTLVRNPLANRQTLTRLGDVQSILLSDYPDLASLPPDSLQSTLKKYDRTFDVRMLIFGPDRQVLADSRGGAAPLLKPPRGYRLSRSGYNLKDETGQLWIYQVSHLTDRRWLMLAVPRPKIPLISILRNEFLLPFSEAGIAALFLSLALAFWLARWVGDPLQRVVVASQQMPGQEAKPIPLRGPREVQELTRAFNAMTARLHASQKSQRDFVANVSHELKTPLTSIQGFAQAILDGTADSPESYQQAASVIYGEAGRMHRMVLDLLDLARLDAGTLDLRRAPLDLPALLNNVVEKFTPQARQAGVTLRVEAVALPAITGDGDRLAQVFTNLVDNALKYTPAGGHITLRTAPAGNEIQVEAEDTGIGISPEALPHIFERFYQVDTARMGGKKHGAGLGLTIVKEIVQAHGGTIGVRSTPGQGSTFTVRLPLTLTTGGTIAK